MDDELAEVELSSNRNRSIDHVLGWRMSHVVSGSLHRPFVPPDMFEPPEIDRVSEVPLPLLEEVGWCWTDELLGRLPALSMKSA